MRLENKDIVNAPANVVYKLVRDDLGSIARYLPNISRIETMERTELGVGRMRVVNHWYGKGEIPSMVQKFISPDILSWKDIATWNDAECAVDYELESFVANRLFSVKGRNTFAPAGETRTELRIVCEMEIYPERVPGVPRFLASSLRGPIEEFIGRLVAPNLTSLSQSLNQYFAESAK